MEIIKEKTQYHEYAFKFGELRAGDNFSEILEFIRALRQEYESGDIGYDVPKKFWVFSKPEIVLKIRSRFPQVKVDPTFNSLIETVVTEETLQAKQRDFAQQVKLKEISNLEIKGLKGELKNYQKLGVEFFTASGGKALLADEMGCLAGDTKIIVNRGGNARPYTIRELYFKIESGEKYYSKFPKNRHKPGVGFRPDIANKTRSLNHNNFFELNTIKKIIYSGRKPTVIVIAKSDAGKEYKIQLTKDHEISSPGNKWIAAGKLRKGDKITVNGEKANLKYCTVCKPEEAIVISVKEAPVVDTYDIVMEDPYRNFIANGVVVHNCGKSLQALGFIVHNKIQKTLVICPASVKYSWENEVHKWTKLNALVIDRKFGESSAEELMDKMAIYDVFVINYDLLKRYVKVLVAMRFDCVIIDESTCIKSINAQRSKLTKIIASRIKHIILLSGTPMLNRPEELFSSLNLLDPKAWPNFYKFATRYCGAYRGKWGLDTSGATNIPELRERISPYFLRRTKQEVLTELPPKTYINVPIELSAEHESLYRKAEKKLASYLRDNKGKTTEEVKRSMAAEKLVRLNELRQITTQGKVAAAEELINQFIENQEKVIVFSSYNEPLEYLREKYGSKAVIITGKTPTEDRGEIIKAFQERKEVVVFLGGTKAAGMGITLTAASNVVFLDFDFVPAIMSQAEDRAHRIGQEAESINIYQFFAKDTIDSWMCELLDEKRKLASQLIDGKEFEQQEQSSINFIFNKIGEKYE